MTDIRMQMDGLDEWDDDSLFVSELIVIYILLEIIFYCIVKFTLVPDLNQRTRPARNPKGIKRTAEEIFKIVDELKSSYSMEKFLQNWFLGASINDIRVDNVKEFIAWASFACLAKDLSPRQQANLDEATQALILKYNLNLMAGYNPNVKTILFTTEPLIYYHRPLFIYILYHLANLFGGFILMAMGFTRHVSEKNGIAYWHRPVVSSRQKGYLSEERDDRKKDYREENKEERWPLLFFHGIGAGFLLYLMLLEKMSRGRETVVFEMQSISMSLCFRSHSRQECVEAVVEIAEKFGWSGRQGGKPGRGVTVAGHSYGSICVGWVAKDLPGLIRQAVFLDPVSIMLCLPDVAYNFLYKSPSTFVEFVIYYMASTELTIAYSLRRQFWWYENVVYLNELECPFVISLSGGDEITPSHAVLEHAHNFIATQHELKGKNMGSSKFIIGNELTKNHGSSVNNNVTIGNVKCPVCFDRDETCPGLLARTLWWNKFSHGECLVYPSVVDAIDRTVRNQERTIRQQLLSSQRLDDLPIEDQCNLSTALSSEESEEEVNYSRSNNMPKIGAHKVSFTESLEVQMEKYIKTFYPTDNQFKHSSKKSMDRTSFNIYPRQRVVG